MQPAITIEHLTVNYRDICALFQATCHIPQGVLAGVIGPNGAGKSTFLQAILGLVQPQGGSVHFWGESLAQQRLRVAYIPQRSEVEWDFPITVEELVLMGALPRMPWWSGPDRFVYEQVDDALEQVGLTALKHRPIGQLSGGQKQRAFIARALMQQADLFLLDEALAGIDSTSAQQIMTLLQKLVSQKKTVVMIHHDLQECQQFFSWVVLLRRMVIASGPAQEVLQPHILQRAYGSALQTLDIVSERAASLSRGEV